MLAFDIIPGGPPINSVTMMAKSEDIFVLHIDTGLRWPEFDGVMYAEDAITLFLKGRSDKDGNQGTTRIVFKRDGQWEWGVTASPRKWGLDVVLWKSLPTEEWEPLWQRPDRPIFAEEDDTNDSHL